MEQYAQKTQDIDKILEFVKDTLFSSQRICKIVLAKSQLLRDLRDHIERNFPKTKKEALADIRAYRASFLQRRREITACNKAYQKHYDEDIAAMLPYQSQPKELYDSLQASCIVESGERFSSLKQMGQDIYVKRFPVSMKEHEREDRKMQRSIIDLK